MVWTEKSIYKMEKVVHNLIIRYGLEKFTVIELSPYVTILPEIKGIWFKWKWFDNKVLFIKKMRVK